MSEGRGWLEIIFFSLLLSLSWEPFFNRWLRKTPSYCSLPWMGTVDVVYLHLMLKKKEKWWANLVLCVQFYSPWSILFTHISLHGPFALLAGDVAAPMVFTLASLHYPFCVCIVATPTAHQIAAVTAIGSFIALPRAKENIINKYHVVICMSHSCHDIINTLLHNIIYTNIITQ